jgi:hypothetical protein
MKFGSRTTAAPAPPKSEEKSLENGSGEAAASGVPNISTGMEGISGPPAVPKSELKSLENGSGEVAASGDPNVSDGVE